MTDFIKELELQAHTPELKAVLARIKDDYATFKQLRQEYQDAVLYKDSPDDYEHDWQYLANK